MPLPYEQNKKHIYEWREKNKEKSNELQNKYAKKYYRWKKIQKEFMNILIDDLL